MFSLRLWLWVIGLGLLRSDGVHDPQALSWLALHNPQPITWYRAAMAGDAQARDELTFHALDSNQQYWLELSGRLGDARAFYALAERAESHFQHQRWLKLGADLGHAPSQYELGMIQSEGGQRLNWLNTAAQQGYLPAIKALYQWYLLRDDLKAAQPLLEQAGQVDKDSALRLARLLWGENEVDAAKDQFEAAVALGSDKAKTYLKLIRQFYHRSITQTQGYDEFRVKRANCVIQLQPVADSLEAVKKATETLQAFDRDERLAALPICLNPPVWLDSGTLGCDPDWAGQRRLGCDEGKLSQLGDWAPFSHMMVVSTLGKANVNNGIMYLDLADTYDVFVHELAHFAGFADEYPLSSSMAARQCASDSAPNLVVVQEEETLDTSQMRAWMQATDNIQLSTARTCNNHAAQAYKPVSELTFMEFYDQTNIPPIYLALWLSQLRDTRKLTPAFVNFSQYFRANGDPEKAAMWWQKFIDYRDGSGAEQRVSAQ